MDHLKIDQLISKLNRGNLSAEEQAELEQLIESGDVDIESLTAFSSFADKLHTVQFPEPSKHLDERFYAMLSAEKKAARPSWFRNLFATTQIIPKLAFAAIALFVGLFVGYLVKPTGASEEQVLALTNQVTEMKEMMMLSLLEKESATDRLKAVSLTHEMDEASGKVTKALLETLNNDDNVNVRLAALEALKPYVRDSIVREGLIKSIANQKSPLVQIALAELMTQIQAKSSVKELEKIIQSDRTPREVKNRIKESIKVLS